MDKNWETAYLALREFVAKNPSIEISPNVIVIPGEVRPEFYRLFDAVRTNFITDNFYNLLQQADLLSSAFKDVSASIKGKLNLESVELSAGVNWFLLNPLDGLVRLLFDPLFDLLKDKYDKDAFETSSRELVADTFKRYFHEGYQRWGTLALMQAASPDSIWNVPVNDYIQDPSTAGGDLAPGDHVEDVPPPVEMTKLTFTQNLFCSFLAPKAIIHSRKINAYMGLRTDFYETRWTASTRSDKRNWLDLKEIYNEHGLSKLWPDLAIYLDENEPLNLSLVADYYKVAQPDAVIEFLDETDWQQTGKLEQIKRHNRILQPALGSFIICREAPPESVINDIPADATNPDASPQKAPVSLPLHWLIVGYDPAGFEPLFQAIAKRRAENQPVQ